MPVLRWRLGLSLCVGLSMFTLVAYFGAFELNSVGSSLGNSEHRASALQTRSAFQRIPTRTRNPRSQPAACNLQRPPRPAPSETASHLVLLRVSAVPRRPVLIIALVGCHFESLLSTYDVRGRLRSAVFFVVFMLL